MFGKKQKEKKENGKNKNKVCRELNEDVLENAAGGYKIHGSNPVGDITSKK